MKPGITKTIRLSVYFLLLFALQIHSFAQTLPDPTTDNDPAFSNPSSATRVYGKIPATQYDVYQLSNAEYIDGLFDGDTATLVHAGWGQVVKPQETWIQLRDYDAQISQLHLMNAYYHESTVHYYAIEKGTWNRIYIGSSNGLPTHNWNKIPATPLATPINASYLIIVGEPHFPKELRIMGSYIPKAPVNYPARIRKPFKNTIGNNFFEWDALENDIDPNDRYRIQENKMASLSIFKGGLRHYLDWERIETSRGVYEFNPTNYGGWDYDMVYKRLKEEGVPVVICLKSLPSWMLNSWPSAEQDAENVPVFFKNTLQETIASFEDPASYIDGAKFFFQLAARYGKNKNIDPALLNGVVTGRIWPQVPTSPVRTREAGLGYIEYLEIENERDKWWKGRKGYQTGREYAAMASAYYDGHKGTLGNNVGAKQADPNMKVVIGGLALVRTDFIQGMIDWCRQYRGYKANGEVDLCFDIINYHHYSNDAGSPQYGYSTRGQAPEKSNLTAGIDRFIKFSNEKCYGKEVWISETGYDIHQESIQKAPIIGTKDGRTVQADWILRSSLLFSRKGIDRVMYYMYKDVCDCGGVFATSGFVESNAQLSKRRPSADYLKQAYELIGNYVYQETLNEDPAVDHYRLNDTSVYVAWIPDEVGRTGTYNLTLPQGYRQVKLYTLVKGSDSMNISIQDAPGGIYKVQATETPVFIQPYRDNTLPLKWKEINAVYRKESKDVRIEWATSNEVNTSHFVLERSTTGNNAWMNMAKVPSSGNRTADTTYAIIDKYPVEGKNFYRVKQINNDSTYTYSKTVLAEATETLFIRFSPNPAKAYTYISLVSSEREDAELTMFDTNGKLTFSGRHLFLPLVPYRIDLNQFSPGVYYLNIKTQHKTATEKLIIR